MEHHWSLYMVENRQRQLFNSLLAVFRLRRSKTYDSVTCKYCRTTFPIFLPKVILFICCPVFLTLNEMGVRQAKKGNGMEIPHSSSSPKVNIYWLPPTNHHLYRPSISLELVPKSRKRERECRTHGTDWINHRTHADG
jgi:hypothetical protein